MFKTQLQLLLLLWPLLLGGCVKTAPTPTPTTPLPTQTPIQTEIAPTTVPEPTPTPTSSIFQGTILPASVYFIDSNTQQIVRLERDGTTLRLITHEANPITAFTVDGASGWLYYVTNNQLIQLQLSNNTRTIKVDGGPITPDNAIRAPRLSPDGSTIVYLRDGLYIMRTGDSAESSQLLAADPLPPTTEQTSRIFDTLHWSPDGSRLAIQFTYYPEGQGLGLYTFADNSFVDLTQTLTSEPRCCDLSFSADSTLAYITNNQQSGITQLTLATKATTNILTRPNEETTVATGLHHTQDGTRYAFVGNAYPELAHPFYNLSLVDGDGVATPLAGNNYGVLLADDLLWAGDDSGLLFSQHNWYSDSRANTTAQWWPLDGTPRLELPIIGRNYQWGEPAQPRQSMGDTQLDTLRAQALTDLNITLNPDNGFSDLIIRRVLLPQQTLWLVHTVGIRPFEQETPDSHRVALYTFNGTAWKMLAMSNLTSAESPDIGGPDYLSQGGVTQAFLGPDYLWLAIEGGIGAHGGLLQIVQFDGATLTVILESGNGSPIAGSIADISGDSLHDVIVDKSDAYVFAYASGVRNPSFDVLQWNGSSLGPIYFQSYDETTPAELRTPNNRAVELANAGRWYEAQQLINTLSPLNQPTIGLNQGLINFNTTARLAYANSAYPILGYLFYGDYDTATSKMASYTMPELFNSNGPLIVGTAAEGGLESLAQLIEETTARAIGADTTDPILAGAHFLRGWGIFLTNPTDPRVIEYVQRSAELAPDNTLYTTAAAYLTTQP